MGPSVWFRFFAHWHATISCTTTSAATNPCRYPDARAWMPPIRASIFAP
jgi:hypothetical protein